MSTLQNKLVKALETIASKSTADRPGLKACVNTIEKLKIQEDDYINTLVFIKLLLDLVPGASIYNKPLLTLYKYCRKNMDHPEEKFITKNKLSKR
jgi:hypothetical protein